MNVNKNTFGKQEKLKSKKAIDLLFKKGKSINAYPLKAIFLPTNEEEDTGLNVGVSVAKRNIKLAVNRNLIKRRMREAYRLNNRGLKESCVGKKGYNIMFIYHSSQILTYQEIESKIKVILNRLTELSEAVGK